MEHKVKLSPRRKGGRLFWWSCNCGVNAGKLVSRGRAIWDSQTHLEEVGTSDRPAVLEGT